MGLTNNPFRESYVEKTNQLHTSCMTVRLGLLTVSSPGPLLYGALWLPRRPCKQDTALHSKNMIVVEGLKQRGLHNRSLMVPVQGPVNAYTLFILSIIHPFIQNSSFIFRKLLVLIFVRAAYILTEVFCELPQFLNVSHFVCGFVTQSCILGTDSIVH
jgi:hypothetical protein